MADHPLRPATRHSLGKPLPYQLADTPQPYPVASYDFPLSGIWGISTGFLVLSPTTGQVATCYAPVRRSPARKPKFSAAAPRLACVKHAASVHSEPGSNSPLKKFYPYHSKVYSTLVTLFIYICICHSGMLFISVFSIILKRLFAFWE